MPKGKFAKLTSWSFSAYTQYLRCPLSVFFERVQRVRMPEEKSPVLERGDRVHKAAETYVSTSGRPQMIPELRHYADRLKDFRRRRARTELEWAFTSAWTPTGWLAPDAWLRMKLDVLHEQTAPPAVYVGDYKTGRVYPEHAQQRSLYGLGALTLVKLGALAGGAKATTVTVEHLYTDTTQLATEQYGLKDLEPLKAEWVRRTEQMLNDTTYNAQPGNHCRWCKFAVSRGGPCVEEKK